MEKLTLTQIAIKAIKKAINEKGSVTHDEAIKLYVEEVGDDRITSKAKNAISRALQILRDRKEIAVEKRGVYIKVN